MDSEEINECPYKEYCKRNGLKCTTRLWFNCKVKDMIEELYGKR